MFSFQLETNGRSKTGSVCLRLFLLALGLTSCGFTAHLPILAIGSEIEAEVEEVESREVCCSQNRSTSKRHETRVTQIRYAPASWHPICCQSQASLAIVGHRLSNGLLAPIRC
ncbi:hypothetical protein OAF09_01760 [bacterium]|nr:hypothetical protein [bacterium]